ncbi:MAG: hypothetical protein UU47_C0027G0012 [candidate division TM6 bacterium GW2011_GWE2_41_16]|nr:MAG: hypothetical protein UU47_C0027G0012 [candidate division TM6 bacterium GW2011_GWE2_41_16]
MNRVIQIMLAAFMFGSFSVSAMQQQQPLPAPNQQQSHDVELVFDPVVQPSSAPANSSITNMVPAKKCAQYCGNVFCCDCCDNNKCCYVCRDRSSRCPLILATCGILGIERRF